MSAAAHTVANISTTGTISATGAISSSAGMSGTTGAFTTSITVGSGTAITKILKGVIAVTLAATAAAAEEDVSLTISGAAAGDMVFVTPLNAAMETGVAIVGCWVSAADTVKVRISNVHTAGLTGSTANWQYLIVKS